MAITIKNERVITKIRQLAARLDVGQQQAIECAVDRLSEQAERSDSQLEARMARVLEQAAAMRELLGRGPVTADDVTSSLYDSDGLPR